MRRSLVFAFDRCEGGVIWRSWSMEKELKECNLTLNSARPRKAEDRMGQDGKP